MKTQHTQLIFCFGPGGAGKTTVAAALALSFAQKGRRVCCMTIDPSKRLAGALGMKTPYPVTPTGVRLGDTSFDALVIRGEPLLDALVKDVLPKKHADLTQSTIYKVLASGLQGLEHYMAIDVLQQLHQGKQYDVVIVDTPPTRHAVNFLEAPGRLFAVLNQQFFKFFVHGYGAVGKGSLFLVKDIYQFGSRVLEKFFGMTFLNELATFFGYFEDVLEELRRRVQITREWIQDPRTACVLIGYEYMQRSEIQYYLEHIAAHDITRRAFVFNQSLAGFSVPPVSDTSPVWEQGLSRRIQLHKQALKYYRKWSTQEQMSCVELPLIVKNFGAQDVIQTVAQVFQREPLF